MGSLAARRLGQMVELGERLVATELVVAAQALDLRAPEAVGAGTRRLRGSSVRERVSFTGDEAPPPREFESLRELVWSGALSDSGSCRRRAWGRRGDGAPAPAGPARLSVSCCRLLCG